MTKPALTLFLLLSACTSAEPTGTIAFSSDRDGNSEIYRMNVDGTGVTRLTNDPAEELDPSWSRR